MRTLSICIFLNWFLMAARGFNNCLNERTRFKFHRIKICQRSTTNVISLANFRGLDRCLEYAETRSGLAVNFSPPETADVKRQGYFSNCNVLGCPENNIINLVNDSGYDYYSLYGNFNENAQCVKSVGLFRIFEDKANYTDAIIKCQKVGGDLAHVASETRTNSLSEMIATSIKSWFKQAYVGLDDAETEGTFKTSSGDDLRCFRYRAWGPGHPRNKNGKEDCVALGEDKSWRAMDCSQKLPFVCELLPTTPKPEEFTANCSVISNKKKRKQCRNEQSKLHRKFDSNDRCVK